ncbi:MAG TPA: tRNA (guanosine(37)-N1)-methyltransferase TrmD [Dehalococcoidia bacterium]|nr:tRNA (guanosine(37)-N1)-methyltransferase TrmD [Dehalococcoidia bacterium]
MRIDILTLFPNMVAAPLGESIVGRARAGGLVEIAVRDIRDYAAGRHKVCDDYPYGGGAGMVMKPEPIFAAAEALAAADPRRGPVVLLSPGGRRFTQTIAEEYAAHERLTLICGHYEGVDERVREHIATDELSVGDFVLSGGEPAAIVVVDAVVRLLPGVLGGAESLAEESHASHGAHGGGLLEYPQYTRPANFRGWQVPATLLSGHHEEVARWRRRQALLRTALRRPDLLARAELAAAEREWLAGELDAAQRREEPTGPDNDR